MSKFAAAIILTGLLAGPLLPGVPPGALASPLSESVLSNPGIAPEELPPLQAPPGSNADDLEAGRALAVLGSPEAQFELGNRYLVGDAVEANPKTAAQWFARAAAQGHAGAQYSLALCYEQGNGVEKDPAQAARWYERAAGQDNPEAQYNLGVLYDEGRLDPAGRPDHGTAVYWYSRAAELGNADAQYNLAVSYDAGEGTAKNRDKALFWYLKAAEQNYPNAQFNLGVFFANAPRPDYRQAASWHARAAERGDREAQFYLAEFYEQGKGLPRDDDQAAFWYRSAADNGQPQAALRLALRFEQGRGVDADAWQGLVYVLYYLELVKGGRAEPGFRPAPDDLALARRLEAGFAARVGRARYAAAVDEALSLYAQARK